jgi:MFS family permease
VIYPQDVVLTLGRLFKWRPAVPNWQPRDGTLLGHRDFRLLLAATFFNSLSYWLEQVALGWLVLTLTNSPFMVGLAYAARMIPFFFLGIPAGVVADRVNRRQFLRTTTAAIGITWLLTAGLIIAQVIQAWHLIVLVLLAGGLRAFFATTYQAVVYDIAGPRAAVRGMAAVSIVSHLSGIVGAIAGGSLMATAGSGGAYLAMGASFAVSLFLFMFMGQTRQAASAGGGSMVEKLREAVRVLRTNRVLAALTSITAASEVFGYSNAVLLPVFARDVLRVGPEGLGLMTAVRSGAGILGPIAVSALGAPRGQGKLVMFSTLLFGAGIVALAFVPNLLMALAALAVLNGAGSALDVLLKTLMQANVSDAARGRAMGAWVVGIGVGPVGQLEIGSVGAALGAPLALTINGGVLVLATVGLFGAMPRLRRL